MTKWGGIESAMDSREGGAEHISGCVYRVMAGVLDRLIDNFGKEIVIRDYINPVLREKKSSPEFLEYLELTKMALLADLYKK